MWRRADVGKSTYKAIKREGGAAPLAELWSVCSLKVKLHQCFCWLVTGCRGHFNVFQVWWPHSWRYSGHPACTYVNLSHLCASGPPAVAELRESSAGGSALQRGLAAGSDWTHRAAEDWNSTAAAAPTPLGQSGSIFAVGPSFLSSILSLIYSCLTANLCFYSWIEIPAK